MIEATLRCLSKNGFHGTSTRRIAEEAGVSASLVKHYFGGISELILESYRHFRSTEIQIYRTAASNASRDPEDKLDAYIAKLFIHNADKNPTLMPIWISFLEPVLQDPKIKKIQEQMYLQIVCDIEAFLKSILMKQNIILSEDEASDLAISISSIVDGFWLEMSLNPERMSPQRSLRIARKAIKALLSNAGFEYRVPTETGEM